MLYLPTASPPPPAQVKIADGFSPPSCSLGKTESHYMSNIVKTLSGKKNLPQIETHTLVVSFFKDTSVFTCGVAEQV